MPRTLKDQVKLCQNTLASLATATEYESDDRIEALQDLQSEIDGLIAEIEEEESESEDDDQDSEKESEDDE